MADDDRTLSVGSPYVRQIKESSFEQDASGAYARETELPGFLEICVDVEGVPWVLARRKAPGLLADIGRAKAAGYEPSAPPQTERSASWNDVSALADRVSALEATRHEQTPPPEQTPSPEQTQTGQPASVPAEGQQTQQPPEQSQSV